MEIIDEEIDNALFNPAEICSFKLMSKPGK